MRDDEDRGEFDYEAMAIGHLRESGTFASWEDWFTEKGLGVLNRPIVVRRIYDKFHEHFFLSEVDAIWSYLKAQKLKDHKGFFMKLLTDATPEEVEDYIRKVKRFQELQKLSGHNMDPAGIEHQLRVRDEFICAHMQERRTIEWMMAKERLTRTEVLEIWDRLRPGMDCPGIRREGPDDWQSVVEAPGSWRRPEESDSLRQERGEKFKAAHERKAERRRELGQPALERPCPEELTLEDFGI